MLKPLIVVLGSLSMATAAYAGGLNTQNLIKMPSLPVAHTSHITKTLSKILSQTPTPSKPVDVAVLGQYLGSAPTFDDKDQAYKISSLRVDLQDIVGVDPKKLNSWAEFKSQGDNIEVNGTLIVTQNQINPVINMLLKNHMSVVGLHDHIGNESPSILYLNFEGQGNEKDLALVINKVFHLLKQGGKSEEFPLAIMDTEATTLNTQLVDHLMGSKGEMHDGGKYFLSGKQARANKAIQSASEIEFSGSDSSAVVEGSLVLNQDQLQKILPILNHAGISIVAIKEQSPIKDDKVVEIHYYGVGKVAGLAKGLHQALDVSAS